jgi:hypothetical protein
VEYSAYRAHRKEEVLGGSQFILGAGRMGMSCVDGAVVFCVERIGLAGIQHYQFCALQFGGNCGISLQKMEELR